MKVFLSYSTNSHFDEYRQEFGKFLSNQNHTLVTVDPMDPVISFFEKDKIEVSQKVDTTSYNANFNSLLSVFNKSDLIVFFPGGLNTIWMLSTVLHHAYYGKINKPIIIINLEGFFDSFINTIKVSLREEPIFKHTVNWYHVTNNLTSAEAMISQFSEFKFLNSVVKIGDYVDYPVGYKNVTLPNGQKSELEGWKVFNVEHGYVQLISAGTPLSMHISTNEKNLDLINSIKTCHLTNIFENGFEEQLEKAFENKYTLYFDMFSYEHIINNMYNGNFFNDTDVFVSSFEDIYILKSSNQLSTLIDGTYGLRIIVTLNSDTITSGKDFDGKWLLS